MRRAVILVCALAAFALVAYAVADAQRTTAHLRTVVIGASSAGPPTGRPAPGFALANLRRAKPAVRLSALRGRPAVVNFFASWCTPCRKEMPLLEAQDRRLAGTVRFVGIDTQDTGGAARALVASTGVTYPVGVDPDAAIVQGEYDQSALPDTAFIDARGRLVALVRGQLDEATLVHWIGVLTAGHVPPRRR